MGWGEGSEPGDFGFQEGKSPVSQPLPYLLSQLCHGDRPTLPRSHPSVGTLYGSGCWEVWMWGEWVLQPRGRVVVRRLG